VGLVSRLGRGDTGFQKGAVEGLGGGCVMHGISKGRGEPKEKQNTHPSGPGLGWVKRKKFIFFVRKMSIVGLGELVRG